MSKKLIFKNSQTLKIIVLTDDTKMKFLFDVLFEKNQ